MSLWGTADSLFSPGTVTVNYANKTVTGSGTSFTAAGITTGCVISIGVGKTFGRAVISGITSDRLVSIATTQYLNGDPIVGVAYTLNQKPVYVLEDPNFQNIVVDSIYGVDTVETGIARTTTYKVAHAGWVGVHTYIDMHGNLRVKKETLVAMSGISTGVASYTQAGDAADNTVFPNS